VRVVFPRTSLADRRGSTQIVPFLALVVVFLLGIVGGIGRATAAGSPTIVSLTFDDGSAGQYTARSILAEHGMHATFYLNSSKVGTDDSYYMTWAQIQALASDGNEIGGHTAFHVNLPQTDPTEAQRQVCNDRVNLLNQGLQVTDFAYPYGAYSSTIESMVQGCGYNSARTSNQFPSSSPETIPPQDPYAIRVGGSAAASTTLSQLQNYVTGVEQHGGGWAPITFHWICDGCDPNSITESNFRAFLDWLQPRAANGTVVKTVRQVIGGADQPAVQGPAAPPPPNGSNALRNASLEQDSNGDLAPDCWDYDHFGMNNFTWTRTTDAHSGTKAERVDITNYVSGDNKLTVAKDLGFCTPSVTPGRTYRVTAWYKSNAPVSFTAFTRNGLGAFSFWTSSATFPASSTYRQASWVTPAIPGGVNGLSFGLTLGSNGFLTVDDLAFDDANPTGGPDTTAPTVTLTAPANGATVAGSVALSSNASDNVAVDHIDFLVDSSVVGTVTRGPFTFNWNSRTATNGAHTVRARAVDTAGNTTTSTSVSITVLNSSSNLLLNPSLEAATNNIPNCWLLGGFGTNSFTWTHTSDAHSGSFAEKLDITSFTNGDRKLVNSQDTGTCAPTAVPGNTYTVTAWYKANVTARIFAYYRSSGGTWTFWTSASFPASSSWAQATWVTPAVPAGATHLSVGMGLSAVGSLTMDDFTLFGNAPAPDTTPPTTTISCNGAAEPQGCGSGWYGPPVSVSLTATDNQDGSGVREIRYTTDGSAPTATNGTVYSGPFSVSLTTTVKYRAFDSVGNAEAVQSQLINVDTIPPTSTISCNAAPCTSAYNASISVSLAANDAASGVDVIRYTTDGSDPTATSGTVYLGPFTVSSTTTVKFRAFDNAGNAEAINSQLIQIDATPPTTTSSCNGAPCGSSYYITSVSVSLAASDAGGSGVQQIRYTTDGSTPTATSGTVYSGPFTLSSTTTVKYRAFDNAGNAEAVNAPVIRIDIVAPASTISCNSGACASGYYGAGVFVSLAATDADSGVASIRYTRDGSDPTATSGTGYLGPFTISSTTTVKFRAFDTAGNAEAVNSQVIQIDTTPPTSTISCDGSPCATSAYSDPLSAALAATDNAGGSGVASIHYTTDGSAPTATSGNIYSGPFTLSSTTTVKYRAFDNVGNAESVKTQLIRIDTVPPSVALTDPADGEIVSGTVTLAATASDNVALDHVDFLVDGQSVGSDSSAPYSVDWDSLSVVDGPHSISALAIDSADNSTTSDAVSVTVANLPGLDMTPPTSTISCNSSSCASSYYSASVSVSLAATDNTGGSGVASIRYTTDGSDPTATTGNVYGGPFSVDSTATVKYRAFDNVGNAEVVNSQSIQIDTTAPSVSLTAPAEGATVNGTVTLTATASDNVAVDHVDFLVDAQSVGSDSSAPYSVDWDSLSVVDGPHSISALAVDSVDNSTTSDAVSVTVANLPAPDVTPPTSTISCNSAPCSSSYYSASVSVSLAATDNTGGSGVEQIRYTTDGSTPTATSGNVYSGPFSIASTGTVKYRAFDNVGNAEAVNSQLIQLDTTPPTSTISCNGSACGSTYYTVSVSVSLAATDNPGGSGVQQIRYTTDGSTPTATSGTVYSGPFSLSSTTTVKYRAFDNAGNAEAVNAPLIRIDTISPTSTISCNGAACTSAYNASVSVSLAATDNAGGSGVQQIRYTTNGSNPTATSGNVYSAPFTVASTTTVKYRAFDNAGNAEAVNTRLIQIDTTAPSASLSAPANGAIVNGTVSLSATASDNTAVDHVDFLVDSAVVGSDSSTPYTFDWNSQSVADGSHTIRARAVDLAGNSTTSSAVSVTVLNSSANLLQNPSLEAATNNIPNCWLLGGYGTNSFSWTRTSDAHTGSWGEKLDVSSFTSGDRKLVNSQDAGSCAPAAVPGHTYTVTAWYKSNAPARIFAYYRSGGVWTYWATATFPASSSWAQATWVSPAVPSGATNLSVGMGLAAVGSVTMDDFGLFNNG
jgi:peptidoglycan/xylan/chitin deacetylase (PgdA/CDA1 family)